MLGIFGFLDSHVDLTLLHNTGAKDSRAILLIPN